MNIQESKNIAKSIYKKIYQSELSDSEKFKVLEYTLENLLSNNAIQDSDVKWCCMMIKKLINNLIYNSYSDVSANLTLVFKWSKALTNKFRKNQDDVLLYVIKYIAKQYGATKLLEYVKISINEYVEANKELFDDYNEVKTSSIKNASNSGADDAFKYELKPQFQMQLEKVLKEFQRICLDYINNIEDKDQPNPRRYNIERHWKHQNATLEDFYKNLRRNLLEWIFEKKKEK